jgi:hypothetical protein
MAQSTSRNLVLVARMRQPDMVADFNQIAAYCSEIAPDMKPVTLLDSPRSLTRAIFLAASPPWFSRRSDYCSFIRCEAQFDAAGCSPRARSIVASMPRVFRYRTGCC